jgi:hypothetical protein
MMHVSAIILMLHLAGSFMLTGIVWWVQIITYPLIKETPEAVFKHVHRIYMRRVGWIAAPLMLLEMTTSILLIFFPPPLVPHALLLINFGLIVLVWLVSTLILLPIHQRLSIGHPAHDVQHLIKMNWIRTSLWSVKGILVIWIVVHYQLLIQSPLPSGQ